MSAIYESLWNDAEAGITEGIEKNRKSEVTLRVEDVAGCAMPGAKVFIEQISSEFLFGANAFMLGGYPTAELNQRYEDAFVNLFNSATIPFYWRDLEPEPGKLRFEEGSRAIVRRPPPDRVVAFCEKQGLSSVGHPLVWDFIRWSVPDWLSGNPAESAPLWEKRVAEIAQRYGNRIQRWDVVNEVLTTSSRLAKNLSKPMPNNYARLAFAWAEKYLPARAFLMINETTACWGGEAQAYARLIRSLLADDARISGIGMQFHLFSDAENRQVLAGERFRPADLLEALDTLASLHRPIHISEITLTSLEDDANGRTAQATMARNFYRLWFSHPAVHAITWWNFPDGGAVQGEDKVASGLINRAMEPKAAYLALQKLIRQEWRTQLSADTDSHGTVTFRGFHGHYRARIQSDGRTQTASFAIHSHQTRADIVHLRLVEECAP